MNTFIINILKLSYIIAYIISILSKAATRGTLNTPNVLMTKESFGTFMGHYTIIKGKKILDG